MTPDRSDILPLSAKQGPEQLRSDFLRRVAMLFAATCGLLILWFTLAAQTRPHFFPDPGFDRLAAFAVLGFLLASAFPTQLRLVLFLTIAAAIGSETLQLLRPTRDPRFIDGAMKVIGSGLGVACFALATLSFGRKPA
jgi:hypothetical protein